MNNLNKLKNASPICQNEINRLTCGLFCEPISSRFRSNDTLSLCDSKCLDIFLKCYNSTFDDIKISTLTPPQFCSKLFESNLPFLDSFEFQGLGITKIDLKKSFENMTEDGCFNGGVFASKDDNVYSTSAFLSKLSGRGLYIAMERQENQIFLTAIDVFGNQRQLGGDQITLSLQSMQVSYTVEDLQNGKYILRYIPSLNGNAETTTQLSLSINGLDTLSYPVLIQETTYCVLSAPVGIPFVNTFFLYHHFSIIHSSFFTFSSIFFFFLIAFRKTRDVFGHLLFLFLLFEQ